VTWFGANFAEIRFGSAVDGGDSDMGLGAILGGFACRASSLLFVPLYLSFEFVLTVDLRNN
jgi:hypothetical protein